MGGMDINAFLAQFDMPKGAVMLCDQIGRAHV
jgi:hypothetical protein